MNETLPKEMGPMVLLVLERTCPAGETGVAVVVEMRRMRRGRVENMLTGWGVGGDYEG